MIAEQTIERRDEAPPLTSGWGGKEIAFPALGSFADFFEPDAVPDHCLKKVTATARRYWELGGKHITTSVSVSGRDGYRYFYATPREFVRHYIAANMIAVQYDQISFQVIVHDDGRALLAAHYSQIIGSRWLGYIDAATVPDLRAPEELPAAAPAAAAGPGTRRVPEEVRRALAGSVIHDNRLTLPPMDKKLYPRCRQVLELLGGPWKGGRVRAHVFPADPTDLIESVVLTGQVTDGKVAFQFFESTPEVVDFLLDRAELWRLPAGAKVYEPSAGGGRIAVALRERAPDGVSVFVNDLDPERRKELRALGFAPLGGGPVIPADFLEQRFNDLRFDLVVHNPPFTRRQDARHFLHAWDAALQSGGRQVCVMGANMRWREDAEYKRVREIAQRYGRVDDLPPGSFKASGTDVSAVVVWADKP